MKIIDLDSDSASVPKPRTSFAKLRKSALHRGEAFEVEINKQQDESSNFSQQNNVESSNLNILTHVD